jgi:polysaccharide deacetylase family protein (PEP-CTERM system associated)
MNNYYLFSIDVEDPRDYVPDGHQYREAVVENILRYLDWLSSKNYKATFFVVGQTADAFPDLIKEIYSQGHEIAAHSYSHEPITSLTPDKFQKDLEKNVEALLKCGCTPIVGYRAPTFSLVESVKWVYQILHKTGIKYSSSVLPAANLLYGWKDFGNEKFIEGVYEIPLHIGAFPFRVPVGGGVYFRCLPITVIKSYFKRAVSLGATVPGYFHSYDIDVNQEKNFMIANVPNKLLNSLMFINRSKVFTKLDKVMDMGFEIIRYDEYYKMKTSHQTLNEKHV